MNDKNFQVLKMLKTLPKITIKRALRVRLKVILENVSDISHT